MAKMIINGEEIGSSINQSDAVNIKFNNSSTGLTAQNVQSAISEVNSNLTELANKTTVYSSEETLIGKFGDDDLYQRVYYVTMSGSSAVVVDSTFTDSYIDKLIEMSSTIKRNDGVLFNSYEYYYNNEYRTVRPKIASDGLTLMKSGANISTFIAASIIVKYTKK